MHVQISIPVDSQGAGKERHFAMTASHKYLIPDYNKKFNANSSYFQLTLTDLYASS